MPSTPPDPEDFRRDAVALVRSSVKSIPVLAKELGVSPQSLRNCLKQTRLDAGERRDGLTSDEREELRRLRRENRRLACRCCARCSASHARAFTPGEAARVVSASARTAGCWR
jgi:transposase